MISAAPAANRLAVASQWQLTWWAFKKHKLAMVGFYIVAFLYLIAVIPGFFAMNDPSKQNARAAFHPPQAIHWIDRTPDGGWSLRPHAYGTSLKRDPVSLAAIFTEDPSKKVYVSLFGTGYAYSFFNLATFDRHLIATANPVDQVYLLGTDRLGRCVWSRIMQGTQISLSVGLIGVFLSLLIGIIVGGISGYYGGRLDFITQRVIEFVVALPTIPIWLALAAAVPQDWPATLNYFMITVILSLTGWAQLARVVRGRFLSLRTEDFVMAARLDGVPERRIIFRHMLPSFASHIIASVTLAVPAMILAETSLSFLGLGLQPPTISWGVLLREAQNIRSIATAPWLFAPGFAVVVAVIALNFFGDGMRDAADPYNK